VDLKNTGSIAGDEVVQLYVSHRDASGAPIRALAGLQRVRLEPGKQTTVTFKPIEREWSVVDSTGARKLVPGIVDVWVGGGQPISVPGLPATEGLKTELKITRSATLPE
jgi:beta-glucosidase